MKFQFLCSIMKKYPDKHQKGFSQIVKIKFERQYYVRNREFPEDVNVTGF